MRRTFFTCLILLFLSGCVSFPKAIPPERMGSIQRVAVVSLLGEEIQFKEVGTTVFNNVENMHNVQDWAVDQHIESLAKKEIKEGGIVQLVDVNFDKAKLLPIYNSTSTFPYSHYDFKYAADYLHEMASSNKLDALILVAKSRSEIPNTNQFVRGYSIYNRSFLSIQVDTKICLTSIIEVVDLQSLEAIARQSLYMREKIDGSYWKAEIKDLSEDQISFIKSTLLDKLSEKVPAAIKTFNLSK